MKKFSYFFSCTILLIVCALLAGCSSGSKTIRIGAIGPLTGNDSLGGVDELEGKKMAVEEVNAKGGINGKQVELLSEDDASQPSQSAAATMKLVTQNKVVAIVGAFNSACTLADMEVISKYKIPMITSGSSSPAVTSSGNEWIARAFPGDSIQAAALANFIKNRQKIKRVGLIYVNDDFGKGGFQSFSNACKRQGIEIADAESFMGEDKDMRTQLTKIRNADVEGLFIWCQYVPGALIMKQARDMNWHVQFYGSTGILHPKTFELSSGAYEGTINSVPFIPEVPDPAKQEWVKRYKAKYNKMPSQNSARAYDAMSILLDALKRAGSTEPQAIRDAIRSTRDFNGLQGKITIDKNTGEYVGDVMIVKAEKSGWSFVDTSASQGQ